MNNLNCAIFYRIVNVRHQRKRWQSIDINAQPPEIMHLITNLIRTGTVTVVDRENWRCRIKMG